MCVGINVLGVQWLEVKSRWLRVDDVLDSKILDDCFEKLEVFFEDINESYSVSLSLSKQ